MPPRPVHTVRFFNPPAYAAHCLAYCDALGLLALSRSNNDIEIWNVKANPFLEKWIPGNSESSIEGLTWAKNRLFSTGLHGLVLEYNLDTLSTKKQFAVTSGPSWCISYNEKCGKLAVGTEEGYICLIEVTDDGLLFDRIMDKQEGRVLCLAWHSSGNYLATGSPDTLRLWDTRSGHPLQRMTTGRAEKRKETIVWSVAITTDFVIISGDSRGKTSFWNGQLGILIDSYQTHKADVLAVSLSPNEDLAYSSGIDPLVMTFQPVIRKNGKRKWVTSIHRTFHTHDVRAIFSLQERVFSVGVDANLIIDEISTKAIIKCPPVPQGQCVRVAKRCRLIMLRYQKHLEVWQLANIKETNPELTIGSVLSLEEEAAKILVLRTKDDEAIRDCNISSDGKWIGYCTETRMRIYKLLQVEEESPALSRMNIKLVKDLELAHHLAFYQHKKTTKLVTATNKGNLQIFDLGNESILLTKTISRESLKLLGSISCLEIEFGSSLIAVADFSGNITCLDMSSNTIVSYLPIYKKAPVSAMKINPQEGKVVTVFSDNHVTENGLKTGKFSGTLKSSNLGKEWNKRDLATRGIVSEDKSQALIMYNDSKIFKFDCGLEATDNKKKKNENGNANPGMKAIVLHKYQHLVHFDVLADQSFLAVEVKPQVFEEQLPPSLKQKKFGLM